MFGAAPGIQKIFQRAWYEFFSGFFLLSSDIAPGFSVQSNEK